MSITLRKAQERGHANHGWLDSFHTFSFAGYHDPRHMGFGPLRVVNDDRVAPGMGFGTHGHSDMEIISYVLEGELAHKDSIGGGSVIKPGDVQAMSAGTGVRHSEFNPSESKGVHFLQIWIEPNVLGLKPGYDQKTFADAEKRGRFRLVASKDGREGSLLIHQDADIFAAVLNEGESVSRAIEKGRHVWVQAVRGAVSIGDTRLETGDGAAIESETSLSIISRATDAEVLVFDLP